MWSGVRILRDDRGRVLPTEEARAGGTEQCLWEREQVESDRDRHAQSWVSHQALRTQWEAIVEMELKFNFQQVKASGEFPSR